MLIFSDTRYNLVSTYTTGKVSTDRQYKKFSSTDGEFFWTVGIRAPKSAST